MDENLICILYKSYIFFITTKYLLFKIERKNIFYLKIYREILLFSHILHGGLYANSPDLAFKSSFLLFKGNFVMLVIFTRQSPCIYCFCDQANLNPPALKQRYSGLYIYTNIKFK